MLSCNLTMKYFFNVFMLYRMIKQKLSFNTKMMGVDARRRKNSLSRAVARFVKKRFKGARRMGSDRGRVAYYIS